jgi:3-hydroxyisobutyrate dehydrogenase-like beta-hydroxyacid dehydrogenase
LPSPAAKRAEAKQAAQGQDFIKACVGNGNDLREVVPGEGRRAFTGVGTSQKLAGSGHPLTKI